ncbi:MAG: hypothetical protein ACKVHU_19540 [Acidimicrobiales bacterium]
MSGGTITIVSLTLAGTIAGRVTFDSTNISLLGAPNVVGAPGNAVLGPIAVESLDQQRIH